MGKERYFKAIIFDMDGVLAESPSSWYAMQSHFGVEDNVEDIEAYFKNEISDNEFIKKTIKKWPPNLHISDIEKILSKCKIMKNAKKTIKELKKRGFKIGIVTCGIDVLANRIAKHCGINPEYILSEGLETDKNGYLTGNGICNSELKKKGESFIKISKKMNIPPKRIIAVGDTKYDIPMLKESGLKIAFDPKDDEIKKIADIVIKGRDFSKILNYIYPDEHKTNFMTKFFDYLLGTNDPTLEEIIALYGEKEK